MSYAFSMADMRTYLSYLRTKNQEILFDQAADGAAEDEDDMEEEEDDEDKSEADENRKKKNDDMDADTV